MDPRDQGRHVAAWKSSRGNATAPSAYASRPTCVIRLRMLGSDQFSLKGVNDLRFALPLLTYCDSYILVAGTISSC
jgi:hypothetical protein